MILAVLKGYIKNSIDLIEFLVMYYRMKVKTFEGDLKGL